MKPTPLPFTDPLRPELLGRRAWTHCPPISPLHCLRENTATRLSSSSSAPCRLHLPLASLVPLQAYPSVPITVSWKLRPLPRLLLSRLLDPSSLLGPQCALLVPASQSSGQGPPQRPHFDPTASQGFSAPPCLPSTLAEITCQATWMP